MCEHLAPLERALIAAGLAETCRGRVWTRNCREWVYFDCYLDVGRIRERFRLPACVEEHVHRGTHDGQERGLYCTEHQDAIMGHHPESGKSAPTFP